MKRHSVIKNDCIEYGFWLVFCEDGGVRLSRSATAIKRDERAMSCSAVLPRALFKTPELRAVITIADQKAATFNIDVKAAGEALRSALGVDIDLQIATPPENPT